MYLHVIISFTSGPNSHRFKMLHIFSHCHNFYKPLNYACGNQCTLQQTVGSKNWSCGSVVIPLPCFMFSMHLKKKINSPFLT